MSHAFFLFLLKYTELQLITEVFLESQDVKCSDKFLIALFLMGFISGCGNYPQYTATYRRVENSQNSTFSRDSSLNQLGSILHLKDRMVSLQHYLSFDFRRAPQEDASVLEGSFTESLNALLSHGAPVFPMVAQGVAVLPSQFFGFSKLCYAWYRTELSVDFWPLPALLKSMYTNSFASARASHGDSWGGSPQDFLGLTPDESAVRQWGLDMMNGEPPAPPSDSAASDQANQQTSLAPSMTLTFHLTRKVESLESSGCENSQRPDEREGTISIIYASQDHEATLKVDPLSAEGIQEGLNLQAQVQNSYIGNPGINIHMRELLERWIP